VPSMIASSATPANELMITALQAAVADAVLVTGDEQEFTAAFRRAVTHFSLSGVCMSRGKS